MKMKTGSTSLNTSRALPNYAFERSGKGLVAARSLRAGHVGAGRALKCSSAAAQRER
jgi:hypothetical protein